MINFCCSSPEKVINFYVLLSDISDNFPLYIELKHCKLKKNSLKNANQYFQDFSKINTNEVLADSSVIVNKQETNKILNYKNSLHTKVNYIIDTFKETTDSNSPTTKVI